jgi:hypothetical protein
MANFFEQFHVAPTEGNYFEQFHKETPRTPPPEVERPPARGLQQTTIPEDDAWSVAAARRQAPYVSPRPEGPISKALDSLGLGLGRAAGGVLTAPKRAFEASEIMRQGEGGPQEAGTILEAATLGAPSSVAQGTGKAIVRGIMQRDPAALASHELGVAIPKGIEGGGRLAQFLSNVPFVGGPLKRAGQEGSAQLAAAGERAAAMPAGRAIRSEEAGSLLRNELSAGFAEGRLATKDVTAGRMASSSNDEAMNMLVDLAKGNPAAQAEFSRIRSAIAKKDWQTVQGGMIAKLGEREGAFDPITFARNWQALPQQARTRAFDTGQLGRHLDVIAQVSSRYAQPLADLAAQSRGRYGRTLVAGGAGGLAASLNPLTIIGGLVGGTGMRGLSSRLAQPSNAASMAQWTRSYDRLINSPSPGAMAALSIATRNLSNNLDEDFSIRDVILKVREAMPEVKLEL